VRLYFNFTQQEFLYQDFRNPELTSQSTPTIAITKPAVNHL